MNNVVTLFILLVISLTYVQSSYAASAFIDATSTYNIGDGNVTHYSSAWADFDKDGDLDLYAVNYGSNNHLFQNNGVNRAMTDVTSIYGLADGTKSHRNAMWIDVDNDEDLDLFSHNEFGEGTLYRNNGVGTTFTDVTAIYGIGVSTSNNRTAKWVDIDNDGDMDYFQDGSPSRLYTNNGPNTAFTNSTSTYNLGVTSSQSATWVDIDNDGDMDLVTAVGGGSNSSFYQNNGPNREFTNVTTIYTPTAVTGDSSVSWGDIDNDGDLDAYFIPNSANNKLYINNGANQAMTNTTSTYGLSHGTGTNYSALWVDIDNDGDLDVYVVTRFSNNKLYQNNGANQAMTDVTSAYGLADGTSSHRSASFIDIDNDGDLDLYSVNNGSNNKLYINPGQGNNYLHIKAHNSRGIYQYNARIEVDIDGNQDFSSAGDYFMQYQSDASYGGNVQYLTSMSPVGIFFGLGSSTECKYDVRIFLPGSVPSAAATYTKLNVCPNQSLSFPLSNPSSDQSQKFNPQIALGADGNTEGGIIVPAGDSVKGKQSIIAIIEPNTLNFNAFLSAVELKTLSDFIDIKKSKNIVIAGGETGFLGIQHRGVRYWQVGKIHSIWYKAYPPFGTDMSPARIIPELQRKPSILGISYSLENLIPPGRPKTMFKAHNLILAHSLDGKNWQILPTSVVDTKNQTVAALDEIGGYYMIVGR